MNISPQHNGEGRYVHVVYTPGRGWVLLRGNRKRRKSICQGMAIFQLWPGGEKRKLNFQCGKWIKCQVFC